MTETAARSLRIAFALLALAAPLRASAETAADPLLRKARLFRQALVERHLSDEGLVLYRIDLQEAPQRLATGDYPVLGDTPTFTGLWAATACTRANAEPPGVGRKEALADAERALGGLEFLMRVTGRRGLLARSVRRADGPSSDEAGRRWFQGAEPLGAYRWRGDVSQDQYANGLLPAASACRDLFPERSHRMVVDFALHLLESDFRLVDPDGRATRFGDLSWRSGFGFNSVAQLTSYAAFSLAAALDPDPRFARTRDELRDRYRVVARSRTTNLRVFGITNYSNDLMAWNLYRVLVPLARQTGDPALADLRHGMLRSWLRVKADGNAYFVAVHCRVEPQSCDRAALAAARSLLERFPLEKRKLEPAPELAAVPRRWLPGRKLEPMAQKPVPIELRPVSSFEWKSNPYRVEPRVKPSIEYTGLDYLAAYWLLASMR